MIKDLVIEFEAAEPAIGEMKLDLFAQLSFKADAIAVPDNEHPNHQLRVDRGPPDVAENAASFSRRLTNTRVTIGLRRRRR